MRTMLSVANVPIPSVTADVNTLFVAPRASGRRTVLICNRSSLETRSIFVSSDATLLIHWKIKYGRVEFMPSRAAEALARLAECSEPAGALVDLK